ncbi:MAG TPA: RsmE family RNA methyltransferase [Candidatus Paceibacterota bacterium]|nr:RsmE family RNA methyltransferase [Candidatus Paceibacterota bacterium]HPT17888.1 RsmE family RNA methyltransferase [Candidatus Paceibacterota bacterium]
MKIHRFIDNFDLTKPELEIFGDIASQIIKVLKLEAGEKIELSNGKGVSVMAEINRVGKNSVLVKILDKKILQTLEIEATLFCAILKKENFELVVQKATECGVSKIVPIITDRTIKTGLRLDRLEKIAKEASEQSGRNIIPEILEPINFDQALEMTKNDFNILFNADGEKYSCILENKSKRNIWIGPEGGWTPEEIKLAKSFNFKIASLGTLTLRGETAAIIATYLFSRK